MASIYFDSSEVLADKLAILFEELSEGKINRKMIGWMMYLLNEMSRLKSSSNEKQVKEMIGKIKKRSGMLVEGGVELLLRSLGRKVESKEVQEFLKITVETINLIHSIEEGDSGKILSMIKTMI